jgi:CRP-like cAMP-binding protein
MNSLSTFTRGNRLLQKLSPPDLRLLEPHLEAAPIAVREYFEKPNKPIEKVFFPTVGIVSVVAEQTDRTQVEVGIIGCEGMTGIAIVLGDQKPANTTFVQIAGHGHVIAAAKLREAIAESRTLHAMFLKYVQAFIAQTTHTAVANARGKVSERLARWLLMAHDRMPGDDLALTHEFLAIMLAVRRAGVTEALDDLRKGRLIDGARGIVRILNRKGLEKLAGQFYGAPEAEYRRLMK